MSAAQSGGRRRRLGVERLRLREHDAELAVDVVRTRAYRFGCRCGATGPWRGTFAEARAELAEHRRGCHR